MLRNGSYYLGVSAMGDDSSLQGNNVASQPITITGGTTCSPDAYEADNTSAAANVLPLPCPSSTNHCEGHSGLAGGSMRPAGPSTVFRRPDREQGLSILSIYGTDGVTLLPSTSSGTSIVSRVTWTAPANGTYYIKAAPWNGMSSAGANTEYVITVGNKLPDLAVSSFYASASGLPGGIIWVSDTVRNQGFVSAGRSRFALSLGRSNGHEQRSPARQPLGQLARRRSIELWLGRLYHPRSCRAGQYYLAAIADPTGSLSEFIESNNTERCCRSRWQSLGACSADAFEEDDTAGRPRRPSPSALLRRRTITATMCRTGSSCR